MRINANVTLSETNLELQINDEVVLSVAVEPEDAADKTISWESSNPAVASVVNGTVYALEEGNVVITATASNGVAAVCKVTVVQPSAYDQLNEDEKKLFDAFVSNISEFTDPSLVKFKSAKYHSWDLYDFEYFAALTVAGHDKSFGFMNGGSAFFKAGLDIPTDDCFDIGKLNAALQEYCAAQGW